MQTLGTGDASDSETSDTEAQAHSSNAHQQPVCNAALMVTCVMLLSGHVLECECMTYKIGGFLHSSTPDEEAPWSTT